MRRRAFLLSSLASVGLVSCSSIKSTLTSGSLNPVLDAANRLDDALIGTRGMAKLYSEADVDRQFRVNGLATPSYTAYTDLENEGFRNYSLVIAGEVERPERFRLAELRAMPQQTQITRLDCVEGWSAVGKWRGVPLGAVLAMARPKPEARYVVFRCFDRDSDGTPFYGSLDLHQAAHPQTILALDLNDRPIDPDHGGPVRLRVPTQLGYKNTKWIRRIDVVTSFAHIAGGKGGYWEDAGYAWYGGI
jgi:DMSO/TMAO reductase YedYZ molybdopterin-dependent catalytic subunit